MEKFTSQSAYLYPILIPLKHSKNVFLLISLMHLFSASVLLMYSLSIPEWLLWVLLIVSGLWHWRIVRSNIFPLQATAILLNPEDEWFVITGSNEKLAATERMGSFVHPWMVVLLLRCQGKNLSIVLTSDNVPEDLLRRLRVRLRYPVNHSNDDAHKDRNLR